LLSHWSPQSPDASVLMSERASERERERERERKSLKALFIRKVTPQHLSQSCPPPSRSCCRAPTRGRISCAGGLASEHHKLPGMQLEGGAGSERARPPPSSQSFWAQVRVNVLVVQQRSRRRVGVTLKSRHWLFHRKTVETTRHGQVVVPATPGC